jgi:ligand-binding sensor domain-containing protein/signal transduction histidine kinase
MTRRLPFLALLLALAVPGQAGQLPIKTYTTAAGLAQNNVLRIKKDSRGFLWFCTLDGLSRFDGTLFTNYGMAQGIPHPIVTDLLEARDGTYWVSTNGGGVARLRPSAGRRDLGQSPSDAVTHETRFTVLPVGTNSITNRVNVVYEDRQGRIWAGTDGELFRLETSGGEEVFQKVDLGLPSNHRWAVVLAFAEDPGGDLWIGTSEGLFVRRPDGRVRRYRIQPGQGYDWVRTVHTDGKGDVWVGHLGAGLFVLDPVRRRALDTATPGEALGIDALGPAIRRRFTSAHGLADDSVYAMYEAADGGMWAGTDLGLNELDGGRWRAYTSAQGVTVGPLVSLREDIGGNLWAATPEGALKVVRNGLTTFGEPDGLRGGGVRSIVEDPSGEVRVVTSDATVHAPAGERLRAVRPQLPASVVLMWPLGAVQDRGGDLWIPTAEGLFRFPAVRSLEDLARATPRVYNSRNGLPGDAVLNVYASRRGDLWISMDAAQGALVRWERATGTFHAHKGEGAPSYFKPSSFAEDAAGALWVGLYDGGLLRYRDGRFRLFTTADGVPAGQVHQLYLDATGRLWIVTNAGGAGRIDDTSAETPRIATWTVKQGLASNNVTCITEDGWGRIYFGSGHGIDQLEPASGQVLHHTQAEGMSIGGVEVALRDRHGALWFGGQRGLSRFVPRPHRPRPPPPVFIGGLRVSGVPVPVSELGETEVAGLRLASGQNQLVIDFLGLGFLPGEALRYQFKLEGADRDWSSPGGLRSVNYAGLAPGSYRFLVRAVGGDGTPSVVPATVAFSVLPPVWRQWWFLALVAAATAAALYAAHRYRVRRVLEWAAMRTRIATDLHDDIGSNLTKIAILSEVARRDRGPETGPADDPLSSIARISRESVASMSDIVWAINPRRDGLQDLTWRMRRFAEDTFIARGVGFGFHAPDQGPDLTLGAEVRRQVYLIFKESVNNVVRHSSCGRAEVGFRLEGREGVLTVTDDGTGFDPALGQDGNGLVNMRRRAEGFGGRLEIRSSPGRGTTLTLRVPLGPPRRRPTWLRR